MKIRVKRGLHQAKVGDVIKIGQTGMKFKVFSKILKISTKGKITDESGNIFTKNGMLFRANSHQFKKQKGKVVFAQLVTQEEFDKRFKDIKVDFLKKFNFDKLNIEDILKIIDSIPNVTQGNKLGKSRFKIK